MIYNDLMLYIVKLNNSSGTKPNEEQIKYWCWYWYRKNSVNFFIDFVSFQLLKNLMALKFLYWIAVEIKGSLILTRISLFTFNSNFTFTFSDEFNQKIKAESVLQSLRSTLIIIYYLNYYHLSTSSVTSNELETCIFTMKS